MTESSEGYDVRAERATGSASPDSSPAKDKPTAASKSKDPSRPKRKKARRACAACQRAHLTCGDERPCERCIKRGLQDDCHDGARKKAKYLRDAPDEALKPGAALYYNQSNGHAKSPPVLSTVSVGHMDSAAPTSNNGFVENRPPSMHGFSTLGGHPRRTSQPQEVQPFNSFGSQASPMSNQYTPQQETPMRSMPSAFQQPLDTGPDFTSAFMDPADTSLFGFDASSLNFGNQYGALEFMTLGHMASGANNPMLHRASSAYDGSNVGPSAYVSSTNDMANYSFNRQNSTGDWQHNDPRMNSWANQSMDHFSDGRNEPNTYSIANAPATFMGASPASTGTDLMAPYESTPPDSTFTSSARKSTRAQQQQPDHGLGPDGLMKNEREHRPSKAVSQKLDHIPPATAIQQRRRNASKIYSSVIKPYPYTARFHALIAIISKRFHSQKRLRIAKALASIRPSFISCTRTLIEEDLILMEKSFQRSLLEYRDHVSSCGTPTIICRRTGEVAYCGESFLRLSSWPVGVVLGKEPNLNVNRGGDEDIPSGTMTGSSRGGFTTPRIPTIGIEPETAASPQPIFLSDLLNDDSVIQFYEDFAKMAFADSKGSVCRPCKVLKYKTKDDPLFTRSSRGATGLDASDTSDAAPRKKHNTKAADRPASVHEQQDVSRLGEDDGTVDCMFCWTVKRDVFEFPMMVVINVSLSFEFFSLET